MNNDDEWDELFGPLEPLTPEEQAAVQAQFEADARAAGRTIEEHLKWTLFAMLGDLEANDIVGMRFK